jgi:hypothetical protein
MVTVEAFGPGGKDPVVTAATRVLITDHHGNPLALVVEWDRDQYLLAHEGDKDFEQLLATFGVERAMVLNRVTTERSP